MPGSGPYTFELVSFLNPVHAPEAHFPTQLVSNADLHLNHVVKGGTRVVIGGQAFEVQARDVFFVPPLVPYSAEKIEHTPLEMINFHFHLSGREGASILEVLELPFVFRPRGIVEIHRDLRRWNRVWLERDDASALEIGAELHRLAARYFRKHGKPARGAARRDRRMERLRRLLQSRAEEPFVAESLAVDVSLSISQMNRRFREAYGTSPKAHWQKVRLARIQALLRYGLDTLTEIADRFGFSDLFYFSKWFKHMTGISPTQFRQAARKAAM